MSGRLVPPFLSLLVCLPAAGLAARAAQTEDLTAGKTVFEKACAECHGKEGRGDGEKTRSMGFATRDLTLGSFKCRCTPDGQLPRDEDLLRTITRGLPGSPMPAHESILSVDERRAVMRYVKSLSPRFEEQTEPAPCLAPPEPVPPSENLIAEGEQIYRLLSCSSCHGREGRADGPAAASLRDVSGMPTRVHNFVLTSSFKCGDDPRALYRTLHTGLNGTPMPSFTEAFLFASDSIDDLSPFRSLLGETATDELREYLARQPDEATLTGMSPEARQELLERRTWALVYYLKSLAQTR